jgi:hypothetical protein
VVLHLGIRVLSIYQEWARIVGDETFAWEGVQKKFKALETFHGEIPEGIDRKYADPKMENHGSEGPLHVGFARESPEP